MGSFDSSGFARHVECLQQHVAGFRVPLAVPQPLIQIAGKGHGQWIEQSNEIGIEFHDASRVNAGSTDPNRGVVPGWVRKCCLFRAASYRFLIERITVRSNLAFRRTLGRNALGKAPEVRGDGIIR